MLRASQAWSSMKQLDSDKCWSWMIEKVLRLDHIRCNGWMTIKLFTLVKTCLGQLAVMSWSTCLCRHGLSNKLRSFLWTLTFLIKLFIFSNKVLWFDIIPYHGWITMLFTLVKTCLGHLYDNSWSTCLCRHGLNNKLWSFL